MNSRNQEHPDDADDSHDPVEEAAMAWLLERDEGFSPGREEAFRSWQSADPAHAAAIARLENAWHMLEELDNIPLPAADTDAGKKPTRTLVWKAAWVSLGAAAMIILGLRLWWVEPVVSGTPHANGDARPQRILLADGTVVTLNANTQVETRFSASERRVVLTSGEAHFDVAHEKNRPFHVTAKGVSIRAVGTAFNVRMAAASVEVVVTSGKVQLIRPEPAILPKTAAPREIPLLEPGDRAVVGQAATDAGSDVAITRLEPAQLREALAWQQEMLVFENTPLREVVAQFNRRSSLQLRLAESEFGERRINGVFAANNVEAFVNLFERGGDVLVERNSDREIVLRKAR